MWLPTAMSLLMLLIAIAFFLLVLGAAWNVVSKIPFAAGNPHAGLIQAIVYLIFVAISVVVFYHLISGHGFRLGRLC